MPCKVYLQRLREDSWISSQKGFVEKWHLNQPSKCGQDVSAQMPAKGPWLEGTVPQSKPSEQGLEFSLVLRI